MKVNTNGFKFGSRKTRLVELNLRFPTICWWCQVGIPGELWCYHQGA